MKLTSLTILLSFLAQMAYSQFTLSARYESGSTNDWEQHLQSLSLDNQEFISNAFSLHLGYWIKVLKDYRWDLIPEIGYSTSEADLITFINNNYKWNKFEFTLNNHIYLFDLESDCNCPTFSKDGNIVTKGLFLNLAPGIAMNSFKQTLGNEAESVSTNSTQFIGRVGFGFDLGITELLTVSPLFNFVIRPNSDWPQLGIDGTYENESITSNINQTEFGLRLNLRFDYVRGQNRFRR